MNADKRGWFLLLILGCCGCALDFGPEVETNDPTAEQINRCRAEMYLAADLQIQAIGFKLTSGIDDAIWLKFNTLADSIDEVFDPAVVDTASFASPYSFVGGAGLPAWWDPGSRTLTGGDVELPNVRYMYVGYLTNPDETLTVYIMWHEV